MRRAADGCGVDCIPSGQIQVGEVPWLACQNSTPACSCALLVQVFLGDQSVGKTSIITRFMYDKFDNTYQVGPCLTISGMG